MLKDDSNWMAAVKMVCLNVSSRYVYLRKKVVSKNMTFNCTYFWLILLLKWTKLSVNKNLGKKNLKYMIKMLEYNSSLLIFNALILLKCWYNTYSIFYFFSKFSMYKNGKFTLFFGFLGLLCIFSNCLEFFTFFPIFFVYFSNSFHNFLFILWISR